MNFIFENEVITNDTGVFLPLRDTGNALNHAVVQKDGKYTVDGKAVQPTMLNGVAYMPLQYFTETLGDFIIYDGKVLRMFLQTANHAEEQISPNSLAESTVSKPKSNQENNSVSGENTEKILAYITNYDEKNKKMTFDAIEWVTQDNAARIKELKLNAAKDFPDGFYIYNQSKQTESRTVSNDVQFDIIKGTVSQKTDEKGFVKRMKENKVPFQLTVENGSLVKIEEQYVP